MAARESYASDRRQSGGYSSARSKAGQAYMYGNVVAKPEYEPKKNRSSVKRRKKVSRQVQKNRNRALHMNAAYVVFLACLLYTSPSPRDNRRSRMPSSA